jgi:hypothetical protein
MINQKFMKLCTLQDPNMKICTLVGYPGPSSFPRIMSLKVVFQISFGSIKMMGTREVLVPHSRQLSYSIYVSMRDSCVQVGEFAITKCILNCLKISKSKEA